MDCDNSYLNLTETYRIILPVMIMASKTNAVRIVNQAGYSCKEVFYDYDEKDLNGNHAAKAVGLPPEQVFKTLVTRGTKNGIQVFCIPVCMELNLKKAAQAAGDKAIEMVAVKELLSLTGYIRGGCSPVGMKKAFPTYIDETCLLWDEIAVSAGERGHQMILSPLDLVALTKANIVDITV